MYIAVALPKILYAVDMWGTPKDLDTIADHKKGTTAATAKLTATQRAGALTITGCLHGPYGPAGPTCRTPSVTSQN